MPTRPTLRQKLQYYFDNVMARGTPALIGGLALVTLLIVALAGLVIAIGGRPFAPEGDGVPGFLEAVWLSLMRTLDPGTMGGDRGWGFRIVMLLVTIGGIFIVSGLIGVLSSGLDAQIHRLRKGRSLVLESGHTVILGWSPQVFNIISELVLANENRREGAVIVVLADQDKVEMEDAIRERIADLKNTKIICRSGSPIDLTDLEIVNPHAARSIIILPEGSDPDTHVIKSVLALTNNPGRRAEPYHIVTQIRDPRNMDVVRMVGQRDVVQPILTNELIARVVAQTSRQSGLSMVYTELMNFGGDEIYFKEEPALTGKTYGEALMAFEDSTLIGIRFANGTAGLNPAMETRLAPGDRVIAISADDDTIRVSAQAPAVDTSVLRTDGKPRPPAPEKCLILGWNRSGTTIIRELDNYVAKGSLVTVVTDLYNIDRQVRQQAGRLKNQRIVVEEGDTTERALLEKLKAADYDHVIVLAYSHLEPQEADAKTLVTLLHLRDIAERDETPFSIVSEMLDLRNRELAEAANVDDFIVSEHLVSLMMSQLSENRELLPVFTDLFDPQGAEIYLKPISDYVVTGQPVNFYTVTEAARRRGETALGYRLMREMHDSHQSYGVHTNPKKSEAVTFQPEDKVIVLAEN